ncbi:MAG: hydantoinase B/oxoprolinase family protein, partial [bacterium]
MGPSRFDPFTLEIIREALVAIGDEMFVALGRTSKSPIIYEVMVYACGLYDARGQILELGQGVTGFLGTLTQAVEEVRGKFAGGIFPGDVFVTNDPYGGGGTHP